MSDVINEDILGEILVEIYTSCYSLKINCLGQVARTEITFKDNSKFYNLNIKKVGWLASVEAFSRDNKVFNGEVSQADYNMILYAATSFVSIKDETNE